MKKYIHHTCSFCGNDWTVEDGFNLKTMQCPPCDAWDNDKPKREAEKAERDRLDKWWEEEGKAIDNYVRSRVF